MIKDPHQKRPTPAWLWLLLGVGIAILTVGGFVVRIEHMAWGLLVWVVGGAVLVTFAALRSRATGRR